MPDSSEYRDLFLCYHPSDRNLVQEIRRLLEGHDITTLLDGNNLTTGKPWPKVLEETLASVRGVAVFIGRAGLEHWMKRQMWFALARQARQEKTGNSFPVVPVLLPGGDPKAKFLFLDPWLDLQSGTLSTESVIPIIQALDAKPRASSHEHELSVCPFQGLQPFQEEHAGLFFGREVVAAHLLKQVSQRNLVAVVGPSGIGKTSLVQAGLIPRLHGEHAPNSVWDTIVFTPGTNPEFQLAHMLMPFLEPDLDGFRLPEKSQELGEGLAGGRLGLESMIETILTKHGGTDRIVLIADQFEELLTLTAKAKRKPFLEKLLAAVDRSPLTLVLCLRGDFYGKVVGMSRDLSDRLQSGIINLGPMHPEELRACIVMPGNRVGLKFEEGLVDRILNDVEQEAGNLPFLEFALKELYHTRQGCSLTHEAYEDMGGVSGAISKAADREYREISPTQQHTARRLFTKLVSIGDTDDGGVGTRRRLPLTDLENLGPDTWQIVKKLTDAGFLKTSEAPMMTQNQDRSGTWTSSEESKAVVVEIVHEALIQGWETLKEWVNREREFLLWLKRLRLTWERWEDTDRDEDALLKGSFVVEADRWRDERYEDLKLSERYFIQESIRFAQEVEEQRHRQEEEERERQNQGRKVWTVASLLIIVLALGLGWDAWNAQQQAVKSRANSIVAMVPAILKKIDPTLVALLFVELGGQAEPEGGASAAFQIARFAIPEAILRGHRFGVEQAAFSPDGRQVITVSSAAMARVWRVNGTGEPVVLRGHEGGVSQAAFSPDSRKVITASGDRTARVWRVDGKGEPVVLRGHENGVTHAAFSPDGQQVVTASSDGTARVWQVDGEGQSVVLRGHKSVVVEAAFSPDGGRIVTASWDGTARVWRADGTGEPVVLRDHEGGLIQAVFSSNGRTVMTVTWDGTVRIWRADGEGEPLVLRGHENGVTHAAFSPDGQQVVTASSDGTARVWRADGRGKPVMLHGHEAGVRYAVFSPDSTKVVTASSDGTARVWRADGTGKSMVLRGHKEKVNQAEFSPDGRQVLTTSGDGEVRVWRAEMVREPVVLPGHRGEVRHAVFSADSSKVFTSFQDGTTWVWQAAGTREPVELPGHAGPGRQVAFSPNGQQVVTVSSDGMVRLWKVDGTGQPVVLLGHDGEVRRANFSPDGRQVVIVSGDGAVRVWRTDGTGQPVILEGNRAGSDNSLVRAAFSPDGTHLVIASGDHSAQVWRADGAGQPLVLVGHKNFVIQGAFSSDGTKVVTASWDGTARVWQADGNGAPIILRGHSDIVTRAAFSPDGNYVVTASRDTTARVWRADGEGEPVVLRGHEKGLEYAAFSPDNRKVVTASRDGTARLWQANGQGKPLVLGGHQGIVWHAAFSPDGKRLATASSDGTARVWRVEWKHLLWFLRQLTKACLTMDQRTRFLGEDLSDAQAGWQACEREFGRLP